MNIVSVFRKNEQAIHESLPAERRDCAKAAYNTRRVDLTRASQLLTGNVTPKAGDLVLASVEAIGQHTRIELASGRRAQLHPGDEIIVCYGARYAPDQFEAYVPEDLSPCNLVAAGGVAARSVNRHRKMKRPTRIAPVGILADEHGRALNMSDYALAPARPEASRPYTIAVVGTAMNAGKTTTVANLVRGYKRHGVKVGAAKVTGTGAGGDRWSMLDAGANQVLDFTDCGMPSTFGADLKTLESVFTRLSTELAASGVDVRIIEVADGVFQDETAALLESPVFAEGVDAIVFAAGDALGALAGVRHLTERNLPVIAVSGLLTASPLATREAAAALGMPVIGAEDMNKGKWLPKVVSRATKPPQPAVADGRFSDGLQLVGATV